MSKKMFLLISFVLLLALAGTNVALGVKVERSIADENDDVEERLARGNEMDITSSDLEFPYEDAGKGDPQVIGLRYTNITIPKGTTITNAWVQFQVDETKDGTLPVNVIIDGELVPNAAAFTAAAFNVTSRARTTAKVQWSVPNWTNVGDHGPDQATPNIAAIIQEIVNQDGWVSGNALVLIISDDPANPSTGLRCAEGGPGSDAALLHIEYAIKSAAEPNPADGSPYADTSVTLTWTPGITAASHNVYFSENLADVNNGTPVSSTTDASFVVGLGTPGDPCPSGLVAGMTYYWRVDEVEADGTTIHKGDVWSFTTMPDIAITDPNLLCWWTFDEGEGTFAIDSSGHDNTGVVKGATWIADGQLGGALEFDGVDDYVTCGPIGISGDAPRTIAGWAKMNRTTGIPNWTNVFGFSATGGDNLHFDIEVVGGTATTIAGYYGIHVYGWEKNIMPPDLEWHHFAASYDGTTIKWYGDGILVGSESHPGLKTQGDIRVGKRIDTGGYFPGIVDNVRIYNIALSDAEIQALTNLPTGVNIIWVTGAMDHDVDGIQDDQKFIDWLTAEGHTVDARLGNWATLDAGKIAELNAADLIIISRSTSSGDFDDGEEPTQWNSITKPIILMNGYLVRSNRWKWMNTTTLVKADDILLAVDPAHPLFEGVTFEMGNMVIFRDNTVIPGITSFVGGLDVGNGTLIARTLSAENTWIAEWAVGVEFYAGAGQIAGARRLLFCAGTQEVAVDPQGAWDLSAEGEKVLRNAIKYMLPAAP